MTTYTHGDPALSPLLASLRVAAREQDARPHAENDLRRCLIDDGDRSRIGSVPLQQACTSALLENCGSSDNIETVRDKQFVRIKERVGGDVGYIRNFRERRDRAFLLVEFCNNDGDALVVRVGDSPTEHRDYFPHHKLELLDNRYRALPEDEQRAFQALAPPSRAASTPAPEEPRVDTVVDDKETDGMEEDTEPAAPEVELAPAAVSESEMKWPKMKPVRIVVDGENRYARVVYHDTVNGKLYVRYIGFNGEYIEGALNGLSVPQHKATKVDRTGRSLPDDMQFKEIVTSPTTTASPPPPPKTMAAPPPDEPQPDEPQPSSQDDGPRRRGASPPSLQPLAENAPPRAPTKRGVPPVSKESPARLPPPAKVSRASDGARDGTVLDFDAVAPPAGPPQTQPPTPVARPPPRAPPAAADAMDVDAQRSALHAKVFDGVPGSLIAAFAGAASGLILVSKATHGAAACYRRELIREAAEYAADPTMARPMDHTEQGQAWGDEIVEQLRHVQHIFALLVRNPDFENVACASAEAIRSTRARGGDLRYFSVGVDLTWRADGVLESISFTNSIQSWTWFIDVMACRDVRGRFIEGRSRYALGRRRVRRLHHEERVRRPDPTSSAQVRQTSQARRPRPESLRMLYPLHGVREPRRGRGGARFDGERHRPSGPRRPVSSGRRRETGPEVAVVHYLRRPHRREQFGRRAHGPALQRAPVWKSTSASEAILH